MLQAPALLAAGIDELELKRYEAEKYYTANDFKKAYKMYYKLAKVGDHYSQDRVSQMYANGEGKTTDLAEAYAWSVLAAESGSKDLRNHSDTLLEQNSNKVDAEKRATKLMKKYGEVALEKKAANRARKEKGKSSGTCTGSRLYCSRG
jgi:TPR repeat protein